MSRSSLASGLKIARFFGITIRVHWSWLLFFFLMVFLLATQFLPMSDAADGGLWWKGGESLNKFYQFAQAHPDASRDEVARAVGLDLWPEWQYWVLAAVGTLGLFVCVLAHELAHSLVAKSNGMEVEGITLFIFGGVARLRDEAQGPSAEFKVAAAGPLMSLAIGAACGIFYVALQGIIPEQAQVLLFYFAFTNVMLAAFNLLPGFPLDGGRLLRAVLWKVTGSVRRATAVASGTGKFLGMMLIVFGIYLMWDYWRQTGQLTFGPLWFIFIGLFLRSAAEAGYQQVALREAFTGLKVRDILQSGIVAVAPDLTLEQLVDEYFYRYRYRSFPVLEGERLGGMIGLKDVQSVSRALWPEVRVRDAMHRVQEANLVHPDDDLLNVFRKMTSEDKGHLPVADGGRLVGIVTRHDIMNLIQIKTDLAEEAAVRGRA